MTVSSDSARRRKQGQPTGEVPRSGVRWQPRRRTLRLRFTLALVLLDVCALAASFWLAYLAGPRSPHGQWLIVASVFTPIYLLSAVNARAYASDVLERSSKAIARAVRALTTTFAIVVLVAFWLKASDQISRMAVSIGAGLGLIALATVRYAVVRHSRRLFGGDLFSVMLICDDHPVPPGDFAVVITSDGYFDPDVHDSDMYDRLARTLKSADRVIVACRPERRASWAAALKGANVQSEILMPELSSLAPLGLNSHHGQPTAIIANGVLSLGDRAVKRVFDLVVAITAIVLLAPLFLFIAVAIRIDTPGPVFFRQPRIGRGNALFRMLKFRSMRHDLADGTGHRSTEREDDRITRVGSILRRSSLDELPQLFNVLTGEMSIVGPRPHAVGSRAANKLFWEIDQRYWHRHAAKPGLTGLAQVRGYRGATIEESDLIHRLQADLEYLAAWSLWKDFGIIFATAKVLMHRNAY